MGVMRLPRPMGIYIPKSPRLTNNMISPPLSPEFSFDSESILPSILPAMEYISKKLQEKTIQVTLLVGRGKPYPTGQPSDLMIIPIDPVQPQSWRILERAIAKASRKFSLGQSWIDALGRSQYERQANEYLVKQSILQNEVVFSQEGLTLLNMDRIYTFKRRMCVLSNRPFSFNCEQAMSSCVRLLHRIVDDFSGRPFSKAFFHRVYEQLDVPDSQLTAVAAAYKNVHNKDAIILPGQPQVKVKAEFPETKKVEPVPTRVKTERPREIIKKSSSHTMRGMKQPLPSKRTSRRGPKTPLSASDVTPITRTEWNFLVSKDIRIQPTITKWTPSATVLAGA